MKVYAHRGLHSTHAENSRDAVIAAYKSDADGIEVDLRQLKDGQIILYHDQVLKQSNEYYDLASLSLDQLTSLLDHDPISLREALESKPTGKHLVLECKPHRNNPGFCRRVTRILPKNPLPNVTLSSESWAILRLMNQKTSWPLAPVVRSTRGLHRTFIEHLDFEEAHVRDSLLQEGHVREMFTTRDIPVIAWTVNGRSQAKEFDELGISGIMTDNEDLITNEWRQST